MGLEIDGLVGLFALSLPLAALATVVFLAARAARRRPGVGLVKTAFENRNATGRTEPAMRDLSGAAASRAASTAETKPDVSRPAAPEADALASLDGQFRAARDLASAGKGADAANALRACLWEAGRLGRKDVQGAARVELGDLCLAQGDPITACEHWQIARDFFDALKRREDVAEVDRRMRSNGCPTDWVLNDF